MERVTERLLLRGWRDEDLVPLADIYADPEVMRFIGAGATRTYEQTAASFAMLRQEWRDRGYGMFAVEVRATGELAGWVGMTVPAFLPEILPAVEIGWRLGRAHWGRGYATEAAREALAYGFDEAGLDRIVSVCNVEHHASRRVMTKLGMALDRRTTVPAHGTPVDVTAITRAQFAAARVAGA
ncbi:GNAT family N-acetyltransferase [Streptomyces sp. NBC_00448]|uniref:GNAT family N-acetyltransferase n=1 Tax=Streptomyces sp. NBC_00448 TaxID=2903652 RepID=UPI002E1AB00E